MSGHAHLFTSRRQGTDVSRVRWLHAYTVAGIGHIIQIMSRDQS